MGDEEGTRIIDHHSDSDNFIKKLHDTCNWNQPDHVAIEYHDSREIIYITYGELFRAKNMVSDYLKCLKKFEFIGINFDIPEYCVVSLMLGILSSEHSFVNIPKDTAEFANLKKYLSIRYVFTKEIIVDGDIVSHLVIHNECISLIRAKHVQQQFKRATNQNGYAYAISTSGTTRMPKVVRVPHSCIVPNIVDLSRILAIESTDKISQLTNVTFDPSVIEIFLALSNSASLFMSSRSLRNNPQSLLKEAYSSQVTIWQITPSVFTHSWTVESLRSSILSDNTSLRAILLGGESFPKLESLLEIKHPQNNTKFYNIYGITEMSCWASITEMVLTNSQCDARHLGHALSHTMLQVRNERGEIVSRGTGSLYIGSDRRVCAIDNENIEDVEIPLFRDTGDVVNIDEGGRILYKGRRNNIIKRFGNKVDTSILEEFVLRIDFVRSCHIIWDDACRQLHLCLATMETAGKDDNLSSNIMKHFDKLHHLYRPDKIHFLDHVEFTSSGKISLQFLKEHYTRVETRISRMDIIDLQKVENIFLSNWNDNLKCGDDGFIKLGGTSIAALQMSSAMSSSVNIEFPELIGMLLRDSTIHECLRYIKSVMLTNGGNEISNNSGSEFIDLIKTPVTSTISITIEDKVLIEQTETEKLNCHSPIAAGEIYTCEWYKYRGQRSTNFPVIKEGPEMQYDAISKVKLLKAHDLEKCVDASPTVFRCSDGNTYATVGSHSGFIFTFGLEKEYRTPAFKVKLPDRIEASVLILDYFRGIVGCYDGNVYCLHLKTGGIIWKFQTGDVVKCTAVACRDKRMIFVGSYDCSVYCLSIEDGSEIWKNKCSNGSVSGTGCLHFSSNTVLFGTLDGSCLALAQSSGSVVWRRKLSDPIFVGPASLRNGFVLFCTVTGLLCCFDIEVNIKLWTYKINGNVFSCLVQQYDSSTKYENIIVASQNKNVYCLQLEDRNFQTEPTLKYVLSFHSPILATPWCENNFIFIACTDGILNIYNILTNRLIKIEKLPGEVFSSPVIENDVAIIGCRDNNVYVLQLI